MARVVAARPGAVGPDALALGQRATARTTCRAYDDVVGRGARPNCWPASTPRCRPGWTRPNLIIDPGLGFAKTAEHNWALLRALPEFVDTGFPVLVGASRKRFLGTLLADADGEPRPPRGPRDRHRGDLRARRPARRVGRAGARRAASVDALKVRRGRGRESGRSRWLTESSCAA